jgi:hypothetical protein
MRCRAGAIRSLGQLGKPDHWQVSVNHLINETKGALGKSSGRDAVYALLAELIEAGYVDRLQGRSDGGKLGATEYLVHEVPTPPAPVVLALDPLPASPLPGLPDTAQPLPANTLLASTDFKQGLKKQQTVKTSDPAGEAAAAPKPVVEALPDWLPVEA